MAVKKYHLKCFDRSPFIQGKLASIWNWFKMYMGNILILQKNIFFVVYDKKTMCSSLCWMQLSKLDSSLIFQEPVRTCHVIYPLWMSAPNAVEVEKDRSPNSKRPFGWQLTHQQTGTRFGGKYVKHRKSNNSRPHDYKISFPPIPSQK